MNNCQISTECQFVDIFYSLYRKKFHKFHSKSDIMTIAISKEVPVHEYGRADIVGVFRYNKTKNEAPSYNNTIVRTFEAKLTDWKRALQQAFRYKFFSNVSIVLMPKDIIHRPMRGIAKFKKLKIGLWGFDVDRLSVQRIYTPRSSKPYSKKQYLNAISRTLSSPTN